MSNFMSNNVCRMIYVEIMSTLCRTLCRIVCRTVCPTVYVERWVATNYVELQVVNLGRTIKRVKPSTGEAVRSHPPLVLHSESNESQWYHTHALVLQIPHRIKRGLFLHDNLCCRCCVSLSIVACCQECMPVSLERYISVVPVCCPWCFDLCFRRFVCFAFCCVRRFARARCV